MNGELQTILEFAVTGGPFVVLYWLERRRVKEVQDARIKDLQTWNATLVTLNNPPPPPTEKTLP